jgi:hypothetical protein
MTEHDAHDERDISVTEPLSAPEGHATSEDIDTDTKTVGEASGGFLGAVSGMSVGAIGGPVGLIVGGLAGALGGWWAGRGVADLVTAEDEASFRTLYATSPDHLADRRYEDVAAAYVAGHLAGRNPDYAGRSFENIEGDLQQCWTGDVRRRCGEWAAMRSYAHTAFDRARAAPSVGREQHD